MKHLEHMLVFFFMKIIYPDTIYSIELIIID